jgi:hypothetical protein
VDTWADGREWMRSHPLYWGRPCICKEAGVTLLLVFRNVDRQLDMSGQTSLSWEMHCLHSPLLTVRARRVLAALCMPDRQRVLAMDACSDRQTDTPGPPKGPLTGSPTRKIDTWGKRKASVDARMRLQRQER